MFSLMQRSVAAMRRPLIRHAAAQADMHSGRAQNAAAAAAASASATPASAAAVSASVAAPSARRPGVGVTMTILRESALAPSAAAVDPRTTSTTVPTREWQVLLVRRSKAPLAGWWALPGGSLEFGETIQKAAVREAKEETNLKVGVKLTPEPFHVTQYIETEEKSSSAPAPAAAGVAGTAAAPPQTSAHFILLHMLADPLEGTAASATAATAGDDAAELRWFSATRLSDMVRTQQIAANRAAADPSAAAPAADPIIPSVARVVREGLMKRREQLAAKVAADQQAVASRVTNAAGGPSAVQAARRVTDTTDGKPKRTRGGAGGKTWEHPAKLPGATPWPRAQRDAMKQRKREKRGATDKDAE